MGYVYNRAAASLRTHRSDAIGVVLTQLTNPYFAEFAAGLQDTLTDSRTVPLLGVSNEDRDLQRQLVNSLVERNVDGIVLVPAHGTTPDDLPDLNGTPLVLMARQLPGVEADYVGALNVEGGYAAADHLYGHGCRRIAFVGGFADSSAREERRGGVASRSWPSAASDSPSRCHCSAPRCGRSRESWRWGCCATRPSTASSASATWSPSASSTRWPSSGSEVGADVRVIGFDDVHDAGLNRPSLSSVAVPARETGRRAAEIVLQRAAGSTEPAIHEQFPVKLAAAGDLRLPPPHVSPNSERSPCHANRPRTVSRRRRQADHRQRRHHRLVLLGPGLPRRRARRPSGTATRRPAPRPT